MAEIVTEDTLVLAVTEVLEDIEYSDLADTIYSTLLEAYGAGMVMLEKEAAKLLNQIAEEAAAYLGNRVFLNSAVDSVVVDEGGDSPVFTIRGVVYVDYAGDRVIEAEVEVVLKVSEDEFKAYIYP